MKSSGGRKGSAEAALEAANRTFGAPPSLPLDSDSAAEGGALVGRRRLAGAFFIDMTRIRPDPAQPRRILDADALLELGASIRRFGILQPISVRYLESDDVYQIISGQRRYEAALAAGLPELPCWLQSPDGHEILLRQIVENWQRADLHPFELADALVQFRDANGYSQKQLAEVIGKSEGEISKLLALLDLDLSVQDQARQDRSGQLSRRHLYAIVKLDATNQQEVVSAVQEQKLTAADTERLVSQRIGLNRNSRRPGKPVTRIQYVASEATVVVTFRKNTVTPHDIYAALDEARLKVEQPPKPEVKVIRPSNSSQKMAEASPP